MVIMEKSQQQEYHTAYSKNCFPCIPGFAIHCQKDAKCVKMKT